MGWIFDLGDIDMPLPDAPDYSKRIYELLKETDLENLTYSQFQGVAEKLFIEPENEDEMRRLVLVQLARMAVRGDWDGFLTGGGGSGGAPTDAEYVVMALNGTLTNERKLTAGTRITITDGGAGGDVTIAADASPVTSLVAGTNITLSPASGLGDVTITAASGSGAPTDAQYVTLATDATLTNERVLTAGTGITLTDGGAGSTVTIAASGSGVTFPLEGSAGSAAAPTYSYSAATNLGLFKDGSNAMSFTSGGTRQMTFASNGLLRLGGTAANVSTYATALVLDTDIGVDSGKITINYGADTDIDLQPDGSGSVRLGDATGSFLGSKAIIVGDTNATPLDISTKTSITNSPQTVLQLVNGTTSTAAAGSGAKIQFRNGDSNFAGFTAGTIQSEQIDTSNHNLALAGEGSSGGVVISNLRFKTSSTPASSSATGTTGAIEYDADYIYICTATDTWKRVAISTW